MYSSWNESAHREFTTGVHEVWNTYALAAYGWHNDTVTYIPKEMYLGAGNPYHPITDNALLPEPCGFGGVNNEALLLAVRVLDNAQVRGAGGR